MGQVSKEIRGVFLGREREGLGYAYDNLGFWPHVVHALDKLDIAVEVVFIGDIVGGVVIICAEIDHDDVRSWMLREVPERRVGSVDVSCSSAGI